MLDSCHVGRDSFPTPAAAGATHARLPPRREWLFPDSRRGGRGSSPIPVMLEGGLAEIGEGSLPSELLPNHVFPVIPGQRLPRK